MSQQGIVPQWNSVSIENTRFMETDGRREQREREQPTHYRGIINPAIEVLTEKSGCRCQPKSPRAWALPADCTFTRWICLAPEMGA